MHSLIRLYVIITINVIMIITIIKTDESKLPLTTDQCLRHNTLMMVGMRTRYCSTRATTSFRASSSLDASLRSCFRVCWFAAIATVMILIPSALSDAATSTPPTPTPRTTNTRTSGTSGLSPFPLLNTDRFIIFKDLEISRSCPRQVLDKFCTGSVDDGRVYE